MGGWPRPGVHCGGGRAGTHLEHRRGGQLSLAGLIAGNLPSGWTLGVTRAEVGLRLEVHPVCLGLWTWGPSKRVQAF